MPPVRAPASAYRKRPARPRDDDADQLCYVPENGPPDSPAIAIAKLTIPASLGALAMIAGGRSFGATVLLLSIMGVYLWSRRRRKMTQATFSVEKGAVVIDLATKPIAVTVPLAELENVTLETTTIQKVEGGPGPLPELVMNESRVGDEIDNARIVLVARSGRLRLTDHYLSHIDSTYWMTRIRRFLRKNGWVPAADRVEARIEPAEEPAQAEDDYVIEPPDPNRLEYPI